MHRHFIGLNPTATFQDLAFSDRDQERIKIERTLDSKFDGTSYPG